MSARRPLALSLLLLMLVAGAALAADVNSYPGWERGSAYNLKYNPADYQTIKGVFVKLYEITPLTGMSTGLAMVMTDKKGREINVHLGPKEFLSYLPGILHEGDPVKVKGSYVEIGGMKVFMAAKLRRDEIFELKFRSTKKGTPYWDMSRAEIFEETLEQ